MKSQKGMSKLEVAAWLFFMSCIISSMWGFFAGIGIEVFNTIASL